MIDYETYCRIHSMKSTDGLKISQIAEELNIDETTVSRWLKKSTYKARKQGTRGSLLDPYKESVIRMLQNHNYSAMQVFLVNDNYTFHPATIILP
jgi:transposase